MSVYSRHSKTGRLQLAIWAGATEPDLDDESLWMDLDDAERQLRQWAAEAAMPTGADNPFSPAGTARIWARWNGKAKARAK